MVAAISRARSRIGGAWRPSLPGCLVLGLVATVLAVGNATRTEACRGVRAARQHGRWHGFGTAGDRCAVDTQREDASWHAAKLKAGDFPVMGDSRSIVFGEPYHLARLIKLGKKASPCLLQMLSDDTPTPYTYYKALEFTSQHLVFENPPLRER